jgi:hypothetical protein
MTLSSRCFFRLITLSETRLSKRNFLRCLEKAKQNIFPRGASCQALTPRSEMSVGICRANRQPVKPVEHDEPIDVPWREQKNRLDLGYTKIDPLTADHETCAPRLPRGALGLALRGVRSRPLSSRCTRASTSTLT